MPVCVRNMTDVKAKSHGGIHRRLYTQKVAYSICMCLAYFICGWIFAETDSALLELQRITSVTLEEFALYITATSFGYLVGSLLCGAFYNHVNKILSQFFSLILVAALLLIIPWCYNHVIMTIAHAIIGCLTGFLDTVVTAEMLAVWGNGGRSFMQAMHFGYSVGGLISPAMTAQFTSPATPVAQDVNIYHGLNGSLVTSGTNLTSLSHVVDRSSNSTTIGYQFVNITHNRLPAPIPFYITSRMYIAYAISACMCALVGIFYLVMFLTIPCDIYSDRDKSQSASYKCVSTCWKVAALINMGMMTGIYMAIEAAIGGFLTVFCVTYMKWSVVNGSYILSLLNGSYGLGCLLAILWVSCVNPKDYLGVICVLVAVMLFIMVWCGLYTSDIGIWITVPLTGIVMAVVFPTIYTWTEEDFFPVTGKIASYLNVTGAVGSTINPIVLGALMDRYSPMWFTYILLLESCALVLTYIAGAVLLRQSRFTRNKSRYIYHKLRPIETKLVVISG